MSFLYMDPSSTLNNLNSPNNAQENTNPDEDVKNPPKQEVLNLTEKHKCSNPREVSPYLAGYGLDSVI